MLQLDDNTVLNDALNRTDPATAAWLRDSERVEGFYEKLRALTASMHGQITRACADEDAGLPIDLDWLRKVKRLKVGVDARIVEVKPTVKALRRQRAEAEAAVASARLRIAIVEHFEAVTGRGRGFSAADVELWAVVGLDPRADGSTDK